MGQKKESDDEIEEMSPRDFVMARLAACRSGLANASNHLDEAISLFVSTEEDPKGNNRSDLLEAIDLYIGEAARAVQLAQAMWSEVDPVEGEPELEEEDEEDE